MNLFDCAVLACIAAAVVIAIVFMIRQKKRGHCIGCPGCSSQNCTDCRDKQRKSC